AATIRNPQALRENLISNNTALYTLNSHINQAAWHGVSWQEIRLMEDQRDLLTRQLEITALTAWNNYQSARTAQALAHENRPLLQTRQTLVEEMYELGEISQIEKLQLTLAIQAEKFQADQAAISLALAIAEINFMSRGIA
ncbi:MAG: TolC family protein, partial [Defluviitaleaceae bacterium]|nr:TolC family protein [Defluviitaleaceae bacterium]